MENLNQISYTAENVEKVCYIFISNRIFKLNQIFIIRLSASFIQQVK
jgi:hypothetical protein